MMKPMYVILAILVFFTAIGGLVGHSSGMIIVGNVALLFVPLFLMFKTLHYERGLK